MSEAPPSEVRCPMCSKPNPAEAEECEFCGARIKPLVIRPDDPTQGIPFLSDDPPSSIQETIPTPDDPTGSPDDEALDESTPLDDSAPRETDWLSRMRGDMDPDTEKAKDISEGERPGPQRGQTDLLGRLKGLGIADEEEDQIEESTLKARMESLESDVAAPDEGADKTQVPDWLSRIREKKSADEETGVPAPDSFDTEAFTPKDEFGDIVESSPQSEDLDLDPSAVDDEVDNLIDRLDETLSSIPPFTAEAPESTQDELTDIDAAFDEKLKEQIPEEGEPASIADLIDDFESDTPIEEQDFDISVGDERPLDEPVDDKELEELFAEIEASADLGDSSEGEPLSDIFGGVEEESSALEDLFESLASTSEPVLQSPEDSAQLEGDDDEFSTLDQIIDTIDETGPEVSEIFPGEEIGDEDLQLDELFEGIEASDAESTSVDEAALFAAFEEDDEVPTVLDDLFAEFEGPIGTGELLSAAHDLPPELAEGSDSDSKIDQLITEIESRDRITGEDELDLDEAGSSSSEGFIDADFLSDLGVDVTEVKRRAEMKPSEESESDLTEFSPSSMEESEPFGLEPDLLAPGSDSLALAPDDLEVDDDLEALRLDPSSAPPFSFSDVDREEMDQQLGEMKPSWLSEGDDEGVLPSEVDELPHVPALILEDDSDFVDEDILSGAVTASDMPSWLQDLGADIDDEEMEEESVPAIELARANLPPWLEAMRPIETFHSKTEEIESVEEQITEAAGPLAGLKGVLLAEPVVAMPRSATPGVSALDITERHYLNTEILRQMVSEEELELARPEDISTPYPIARWISAFLVVLAVSLPMLLGFPTFKEPRFAPRGLNTLLDVVNSSSTDQPVLMVFDYEPGYSAEMDTAAGALVENVLSRGQSIVTLSTRQTGSLLADRMILRIGSEYEIENGIDYVHLGYLSGGPTAIQLFASSPRESLTSGFRPPEDDELGDGWTTPALNTVNQISDFSTIAIITSGTESARMWMEQLNPALDETPLIMVVTAGAEPIVRPYFESVSPQISGILTGLQAAVKYEVWNGRLGDASQRWNSFGMGMIAAELVLIAGLVYGFATWFLKQRKILSD
jgi:hypothetical protein